MKQLVFATLVLTCLCSCATREPLSTSTGPCSVGEASLACQVQRYRDAT